MRTLFLVLACIGVGFGIAKIQNDQRTGKITNIAGSAADMDAVIQERTSSQETQGKIEVLDGESFNFGTMKQGSKRSHTFVFKNVGGKPVNVAFKSSSCKCTVGKFKEALLNPGEKTDVDLEWYAEKGITDFSQTATIVTDAPAQEEIKLSIHGKIGVAHVFDPPEHDFGDFLANQEYTFKGKFYSFEEKPINFTNADWSNASQMKNVTVQMGAVQPLKAGEIPAFADARQVLDFTVVLKRGIPAGRFDGNVVFKGEAGSDGNQETYNFPMKGRSITVVTVIGGNDYNEETNILSLGSASAKVGLKKSVLVKVVRENNVVPIVTVGEVTPASIASLVKVTVGEPKVSAKHSIFPVTLEIPPGSPSAEFDGTFGKDFAKIVLETNIESAPKFPMYIKFRISE
jgi:hypothetical protein